MAKKVISIPIDQNIIDLPIEAAMPENYLPYAVDVAKDRALPDVRDGLKPVHRRILYGAYLLKAFPDKGYYKSARIVGDIMGKFHPHGDSSIYDAMTILAQDFSTRLPLIEGQGNWGSQDGDPAAAMRYTEARLSKAAMAMLEDIEMNTVDFTPNYSDTEMEPDVLPAKFPNLLVNGTFGIAVGLSTNIPPHNLGETLDATCALIDDETLTNKDLMKYIKGPDLPTGGIIIGKKSILDAYETGEGKCILRAKTEIEKLENNRYGIVITEFPYRKNKARILQTISEMTGDKKHQKQLESIAEIRDESGRIGTRAVIELKSKCTEEDAQRVEMYLLKKTDLQSNLNFNMVAIDKGKPVIFSLKEMLKSYIEHQREIFTRRTKKQLETAEKRFHIVEGFIKAIDVMDELIKVIRASQNKKNASDNIIEKFGFSQEQATAILELMLYRLTGLELHVFQKEHQDLINEMKRLKNILSNLKELDKLIKEELMEVKKKYDDPRRTKLITDENEASIDVEKLTIIEDNVVTISREGFIKKVPLRNYTRASSIDTIELREEDSLAVILDSNTKDKVLIFTDAGKMYQIGNDSIPETKWKDKGVRIDELIKSNLEEDKVIAAFSFADIPPSLIFKFFTDRGNIKRTLSENFKVSYSKIIAIKLGKEEKVVSVIVEDGVNYIDNSIQTFMEKQKKDDKSEASIEESSIIKNINDEELMVSSMEDAEDSTALPTFIEILTKNSLSFTLSEPLCEVKDKMIKPDIMVNLPLGDRIVKLNYRNDYAIKEFTLNFDGEKLNAGKNDKVGKNFLCDSNMDILFVLNTGRALKYSGFIFENLKSSINLRNLFNLSSKERIIGVIPLDENFLIENEIIFATSEGLVKKTGFNDFKDVKEETSVIKFKNEKDRLIFAEEIKEGSNHLILVTKMGMGLKFKISTVSKLGKSASGVIGISLKEDDEVIYGTTLENFKELVLHSDKDNEVKVKADMLVPKGRASRGTRLTTLVMDESLDKVLKK